MNTCGEILNNTGRLVLLQENRRLLCNLQNMQLTTIERANIENGEARNFALLFQVKFPIGDMQYNVRHFVMLHLFCSIISAIKINDLLFNDLGLGNIVTTTRRRS